MTAIRLSHHDDEGGWRRDAGLVAPRAALGATMLYHGIDKIRDPEKTVRYFEGMGLRPARFWTRATAIAETGAGALALAGVLVRPAALAILITQSVAIAKVHAPKGFPTHRGGFEFNLVLMAIASALLVGGSGRYSGSGLLARTVERRGWRSWVRPRRRRGLLATLVHLLG